MTTADGKLPVHVAIIMDGNGRWAKQRGFIRSVGHKAGFDNFVDIVGECDDMGIRYLTVYAFSTENWNRDKDEVGAIISLMNAAIPQYVPKLKKRNIRLRVPGDLSRFDTRSRASLEKSVAELDSNTGMTLSVCLSYGGRDELVHAFNALAAEGKTNITERDISEKLYTAGTPDPDLVIRTGGEKRISNFLLWQSAYAEFVFSELYWPDFGREALHAAFAEYADRSRRYGK